MWKNNFKMRISYCNIHCILCKLSITDVSCLLSLQIFYYHYSQHLNNYPYLSPCTFQFQILCLLFIYEALTHSKFLIVLLSYQLNVSTIKREEAIKTYRPKLFTSCSSEQPFSHSDVLRMMLLRRFVVILLLSRFLRYGSLRISLG